MRCTPKCGLIVTAALTVALGVEPLRAAPAETRAEPRQEASGELVEDPQASTQEAAPPPQLVAEGEIQPRAEVVTTALRRIEELIQADPGIAKIDKVLESRETSIEVSRGELDALASSHASFRHLEDVRLPWLEVSRELSSWKAKAEVRFAALQKDREYLRTVRAQWEQTRAAAADQELTPDQLARVEAVLEEVVDVETRLRERRDEVGSLIERIVASQELISDAVDRIDALAERKREEALTRNAPPLWRALGANGHRSLAIDPAQTTREWVDGLAGFARLHPGGLLILTLCFPGLLWAAFRLRRRSREAASAADEPSRAQELLDRPFSVALAATLLLTLLILPYPTGSASDLMLALTVVPIVRLGSVLLERSLRSTLYQVVALTLLVRVAAIWADGSRGSRFLLLAVTGLALVVAVSRVRLARSGALQRRWEPGVLTLALVSALMLAVALVANVLGWLQLSRTLTEATIFSTFSAIGWLLAAGPFAETLLQLVVGSQVGWLSSLRRNEKTVTRVLLRAAGLIAVWMWLRGTLIRFQLHRPVMKWAEDIGGSEFAIGELTIATGDLLAAVVVLLTVWVIARLVLFLLREHIVPSLRLRRGTGESILSVANYTIWGVGIALAASSAGLSGTQLAVVIGALGLGIGFGLQTIVNNFVSGLILIFERPIKVGDTLEMPTYWGRVERIGIRASVIRSFDGAEITVPNGDLISKEVVNWTGTDEIRRVEVLLGVAYGSDPDAVLEILRRMADEHPLVLEQPEVRAQMIRFGESALEFRLRCWTSVDQWVDVVSDLHVAIVGGLAAAGITIPFPQRDLHIKSTAAGVHLEAGDRRDED